MMALTGKVILRKTVVLQVILSILSEAEGPVVYICSDNGLSCTNGKSWVTYKKNDNDSNGKAIIKNYGRDDDTTVNKTTKEIPFSPSISHNFIIGVDADKDVLWVATSKGVSRENY